MKRFINCDPKRGQLCLPEPSPTRNLRTRLSALLALTGLAALALCLTGCQTVGLQPVALTASYQPDNFYLSEPTLPLTLKRVAVLPLACDNRPTDLADGREALNSVLVSQLIDTKKFEVVRVSPEELNRLTGRPYWSGEEVLPANFLSELRNAYNCDAVLFCQLTEFRPYPPLAVGWRFKLVNAKTHKIIWAEDEQFDAGKPSVIAGALRYQRQNENELDGGPADWLALNSPRLFGQYTVAEMFSTLPPR